MRQMAGSQRWSWDGPWTVPLVSSVIVALLALNPTPLVPIANVYRDVCQRIPVLALITNHLPPLPAALLFTLLTLALANGARVGVPLFLRTRRCNRQLNAGARPLPARLIDLSQRLGVSDRLTYLDEPQLIACCYRLVRPKVAITAGLLARLDDQELLAVLAHERQHLRRRDPARYLMFAMLEAAAFMLPIAAAVRYRLETRAELAADRAAIAVASRAALASALLHALARPTAPVVGAAALSATAARIAHLAGRPALPPVPLRVLAASIVVLVVVALAVVDLATSTHLARMVCPTCPWA